MKRTRHNIEFDILSLTTIPRRKTEIVYKCNLNFNIVKGYILKLIEKDCMKEIIHGKNRLFETTEKGLEYLEHYKALGF